MSNLEQPPPPQMDNIVGMDGVGVTLTPQQQQSLLEAEQTIVINPPLEEVPQGPPPIKKTSGRVVTPAAPTAAPSNSQPVSPLEEAQAPLLQSVQETEMQQGGLLPQDQHDVPPTLQNELPTHTLHHQQMDSDATTARDNNNVRPVLAPAVMTTLTTTPEMMEVTTRGPSSPAIGSPMDPTIAISPQLLLKPGTLSVKVSVINTRE